MDLVRAWRMSRARRFRPSYGLVECILEDEGESRAGAVTELGLGGCRWVVGCVTARAQARSAYGGGRRNDVYYGGVVFVILYLRRRCGTRAVARVLLDRVLVTE